MTSVALPDCEEWRDFLQTYKNLPELWDPEHKYYKDAHFKRVASAKLLAKLQKIEPDATEIILKKKIANMRTCYRRELKKVMRRERDGDHPCPRATNLWYFELLHFLQDIKVQKQPWGNWEEETMIDPIEETKTNICSNVKIELKRRSDMKAIPAAATAAAETSAAETSAPTAATTAAPKISLASQVKKPRLEPMKEHVDRVEPLPSYTCNYRKTRDEATIYAEGWACMYRKMNPDQQLYAKQAVDEIMMLGRINGLALDYMHRANSPLSSRATSPYILGFENGQTNQ